jgi:putative membrane protein
MAGSVASSATRFPKTLRYDPPVLAALVSALHVLALGVGLGAVFVRGRALRAVRAGDAAAVRSVLVADGFWGVAAVLWLATGLTRLFAQLDKGLDFYLYNGLFWTKMALFVLVLALEIMPMATFIRWRVALGDSRPIDTRHVGALVRINDAETALVVLIPFVAAAMARGLWLFA